MIKILLPILFVLNTLCAQHKEVSFYVPLKTQHYWYPTYSAPYVKGQGGNIGLILIQSKIKKNHINSYSIGVVRNSYGNESLSIQKGWGIRFPKFDVSANIGFMTGYHEMYDRVNYDRARKPIDDLPQVFKDNGISPTISLVTSYKLTKVISPTIVISPVFVNGGLSFNL